LIRPGSDGADVFVRLQVLVADKTRERAEHFLSSRLKRSATSCDFEVVCACCGCGTRSSWPTYNCVTSHLIGHHSTHPSSPLRAPSPMFPLSNLIGRAGPEFVRGWEVVGGGGVLTSVPGLRTSERCRASQVSEYLRGCVRAPPAIHWRQIIQ
jgi:hypothetical protein